MGRILYGAPKSEQEEENVSVAQLRKDGHEIIYVNDWLSFALELLRCKGQHLRKYDRVFYDTRLCRQETSPKERAHFFRIELQEYLEHLLIPVYVGVDRELQGVLATPAEGNIKYILEENEKNDS